MYSEEVEGSKVIVLVILSTYPKLKSKLQLLHQMSLMILMQILICLILAKWEHIIQYKTLYHYHHPSPKYRAFLSPKYCAFMSRLFAEHMPSCGGEALKKILNGRKLWLMKYRQLKEKKKRGNMGANGSSSKEAYGE